MMPIDLDDATLVRLEQRARDAARNAHAPYSRFSVGAAVLDGEGRMHAGCNVENASFGLTLCAERNAVAQAVAQGAREIRAVLVYTPTDAPTAPCGACRQVLHEFGPRMQVICVGELDGRRRERRFTLDALLPDAFGSESL